MKDKKKVLKIEQQQQQQKDTCNGILKAVGLIFCRNFAGQRRVT